jgi:hypothetical protein
MKSCQKCVSRRDLPENLAQIKNALPEKFLHKCLLFLFKFLWLSKYIPIRKKFILGTKKYLERIFLAK